MCTYCVHYLYTQQLTLTQFDLNGRPVTSLDGVVYTEIEKINRLSIPDSHPPLIRRGFGTAKNNSLQQYLIGPSVVEIQNRGHQPQGSA